MVRPREPETAEVLALSHDGRGIAAPDGKKVFVAGGLPGERVRIVRRKVHRRYDEAELLAVLTPSPARIAPRCEVFGTCGGCALQHLSAADQRELKQAALADNLGRIGGVEPERWLDPLHAPGEGYGYRRRARLAVKDVRGKGRVLVGFRERHAPYVTDMHRCEVLAPPFDALIDPLSELVGALGIRTRLPQVEIAVAENAAEAVFRVLDEPSASDRERLIRFGQDHGIRVSLQPGGPDSVVPLAPGPPPAPLYYRLPEFDLRLEFAATDFVQVNADVNRLMVRQAVALLDVAPGQRVLDLYCGIGNFSLPLARRAGNVLGVEASALVARAAANAAANGIGGAEFVTADLAAVDGREPWLKQPWDRVLLDPPRSGAAAVARCLAALKPRRIVCVSCHPATLARDAGILVNHGGYRLEAAGIIDMFPHTAHAEAMAVFVK